MPIQSQSVSAPTTPEYSAGGVLRSSRVVLAEERAREKKHRLSRIREINLYRTTDGPFFPASCRPFLPWFGHTYPVIPFLLQLDPMSWTVSHLGHTLRT